LPGKHGPNSLKNYIAIHETVMDRFVRDGFVEHNGVTFQAFGAGLILIEGVILCEGGLVCRAEKTLEVMGDERDPQVQTIKYAYNVHLSGGGNLFRYDNVHVHPGLEDENHRHGFDLETGQETVTATGLEWPTLGEVLEEMRQWHWDHLDRAPARPASPRPK